MTDMIDRFNEIVASEESDTDKLRAMFEWTTQRAIEGFERDIELAKALKDRESMIRAQIRLQVMKSAREMLADCHKYLTQRSSRP